jgi:hypothetical protein
MLETLKKQTSLEPKICPFLGIREDKETSFAFPSTWNCCHLSRPLAPLTLELQREQCLTENFSHCPVFAGGEKVRLPAGFRLKQQVDDRRLMRGLVLWLLVLMVGAGAAWFVFAGELPLAVAGLWSGVGATALATGSASPSSPVVNPIAATVTENPAPSQTPRPFPSVTDAAPVAGLTQAGPSPAVTVCGYALDEIISSGKYQFVIHKVSEGESTDLLETKFETTTQAIQTANYFLPVPLWVDMVIVIPIGGADLANMPAFEPYYVPETSLSLNTLAGNLSASASELQEYNGWKSECQVFSGWILVPRERTRP